jgi:TraX protein
MFSTLHENAAKYGRVITTHDVLKCLAVLLMTIDHIGFFFFPEAIWWRVFGRVCVPIWFFFVGFSTPASPRKDMLWLCLLLIAVDLFTVNVVFPINILATIYVARYIVNYMATRDRDAFMLLIFTAAIAVMIPITDRLFEYGALVFFFSLAGHYYKHHRSEWIAPATLFLGFAIFSAHQAYSFGMTTLQAAVMTIMLAAICILLSKFCTRTVPMSGTNVAGTMMRYVGRNTHYYYVAHYMLFVALDTYLNPPAHWRIEWFY